MRVTNQMMAENAKANLYRQMVQLYKTQEKIATGKRINRPSDDPIGMTQILGYRKTMSSMSQYTENITDAKLHINTIETILDTVSDFLTDAKRIASDPDPQMRSSFAVEVGTIRDQVLQLANSQINGNYLFAGDLTDTAPFDSAGVYAGDNGTKDVVIGDNLQINLEADGSQIFQGVSDVFDVLTTLQTALLANDSVTMENQITPLSDAIQQINDVRAQNAVQYQRMEATENHYTYFKSNVQDLLSRTEEIDMASAAMDLQIQQTAYQATLASSAKIIQPTLVDFLS